MAKLEKYHMKNMDEIFESWNLLIYRKLEEVDHILARISYESMLSAMPQDYRTKYMNEKLIDMIDQIAENREGKK